MRRTGAPPPPARSAPPQHHCRTANTEHITSSALTSAGLGSSNRRHTLQRCQAHSRHIIQVGRTRRLRLTMDHSTTVGSSSVSFDSSTVPDHGRFRRTRPGRSLRVTGVRKLYGDAPSIAPNVVSMERSVREAIKRHPYILLVTMLESPSSIPSIISSISAIAQRLFPRAPRIRIWILVEGLTRSRLPLMRRVPGSLLIT